MTNHKSHPAQTFPPTLFHTTPTSRNGSGFHGSHGKPTEGPGQWTFGPEAKLPPRSHEMHPRERHRFHKAACATSIDAQGLMEIVRTGGEFFDATWGAEKSKFEHDVLQALLEIERLEKERQRLNAGLDLVPPPAVTGRPPQGFPRCFTPGWWVVLFLFVLFAVSSASALWNIAVLYLPTAQSLPIALLIATPWVMAAIGAKILTRGLPGRGVAATKGAAALLLLLGMILWLLGMMPLAAGLSLGDGMGVLLADRRLAFAGQLLCEFAAGFLFLTALMEIMERRSPAPLVTEVDEIHGRLAAVNRELQYALMQKGKAEGNLLEWNASRSAFIEEGITIFHLRQGNSLMVAELERQLRANQKMLDEYVAPPPDPAPSSSTSSRAAVLLAACLLAGSVQTAPAEPVKEIVLALSPFHAAARQESREALLQDYLLKDCPNGGRIVAIDGWNLTTIFDVRLPSFRFDSPQARAPKALPALDALRRWARSNSSGPAGFNESGAIKIPQCLKLASALPFTGRRAVVLMASPFNLVPNEPGFSMTDRRFPGDGHLALSGDVSVYGLAGAGNRLTNTTVLWAYASESIWESDRHRDCIERWWSLYIAQQGGTLAGFGADTLQLLRAATNAHARSVAYVAVNPADSEMVMHVATNRIIPEKSVPLPKTQETAVSTNVIPVPAASVSPIVVPPQPAPPVPPVPREEEASSASGQKAQENWPPAPAAIPAPPEIPTPPDNDIGIAIFWQGSADIDLRVAAGAGLPEACWNRPSVESVRHFRDVRVSKPARNDSQWKTAWEYCEVARAQLDQPVVWLNAYDASGPVSGIIRVQFQGRVADQPFHFSITRGDRERNGSPEARVRSACWQRIDLTAFFRPAMDSRSRH